MATAQDTHTDAITEPQQILHLSRAGLSYRQIGRLTHLSASTVTRRLKEATTAEILERRWRLFQVCLFSLFAVLAAVATAALATIAWRH